MTGFMIEDSPQTNNVVYPAHWYVGQQQRLLHCTETHDVLGPSGKG